MPSSRRAGSFEGASDAPTVAPSASSVVEQEKERDTQSIPETASIRNAAVVTQPIATGPFEADKAGELTKQVTAKSVSGDDVQQVRTREDGTEYPTGMKLGLITLALCLSVFLMALDNSIIATAIPKISDEFHSLADVGWYGSGMLSPRHSPHRPLLLTSMQPTSLPQLPSSSSSESFTHTWTSRTSTWLPSSSSSLAV